MESIRLYRSEHVWIADIGEDGVFPLPFSRATSPSVVMTHVLERNPDAEIFCDFIGERPNGQPSPVQTFIAEISESNPEWMQSARGAA
jgi:hypothetical protein